MKLLKNFRIFLYLLLTIVILQGCNTNDKDNVSAPPENAPIENEDNTINSQENKENENSFKFTSFDLDVNYKGNKSFDVNYENETDGMEAKIEDQVNNETLRGDDAFTQLSPIFESFTFDKTTPDDEVISEILKAFNLDTNYSKFELDVDFTDGTSKEYKR